MTLTHHPSCSISQSLPISHQQVFLLGAQVFDMSVVARLVDGQSGRERRPGRDDRLIGTHLKPLLGQTRLSTWVEQKWCPGVRVQSSHFA